MTASHTAPSHRSQALPIALFIIIAMLLAVAIYFCARSAGQKAGQRDAREKIETETDLTAGPESLMSCRRSSCRLAGCI